jgi:hypothetical protein
MNGNPINLNDPNGDSPPGADNIKNEWIMTTGVDSEEYQGADVNDRLEVTSEETGVKGYYIRNPNYVKSEWVKTNVAGREKVDKPGVTGNEREGDTSEGTHVSQGLNLITGDPIEGSERRRKVTLYWHEGGAFYKKGWYSEEVYNLTKLDQAGGQVMEPFDDLELFFGRFGGPGGSLSRQIEIADFNGFVAVLNVDINGYIIEGAKFAIDPDVEFALTLPAHLFFGGMTGFSGGTIALGGRGTALSLAKQGFSKGATSEIILADGRTFVGVSSSVKAFALTDEMSGVIMNAGRTGGIKPVPKWFGGCAEVSAVQQARAAGYSWQQIKASQVNAYNIGGRAGSAKPMCSGCFNMFDILPK